MSYPFLMLLTLGIISYGAGIVSYFIGRWISKGKKIREFLSRRLGRYITLTQKWGGVFIAIAALFPFTPFPLVIIAVSVLKYPFKKLLLFALFRVVRFLIQGVIMFKIFDF